MKDILGSLELNRIYQFDCLEGMKLLPDKCIDLICIDPPYNIGKAKWDKWKTVELYVSWMGEVFKQLERVLKKNGSFYWFHNDFEQMSELQYWLKRNTEFKFKQLLVWDKYNGSQWNQLNAIVHSHEIRNYPQQAEYCMFYTFEDDLYDYRNTLKEHGEKISPFARIMKERMKELNLKQSELSMLQLSRNGKPTGWISNKLNGSEIPTREQWELLSEKLQVDKNYDELLEERQLQIELLQKDRYTFNNQVLPSVWQHEPIKQNGHITPKPIDILKKIIMTSSNENDVVLDCFMGSGSTAVAASTLNRKWIGFERETKYIEIANKRLEQIELHTDLNELNK